jgi:hypothetical protein
VSHERPATEALATLLTERGMDHCLLCDAPAFLLACSAYRWRPGFWPNLEAKLGSTDMRSDRELKQPALDRLTP